MVLLLTDLVRCLAMKVCGAGNEEQTQNAQRLMACAWMFWSGRGMQVLRLRCAPLRMTNSEMALRR